jgi:phosphoglycolate phosphatase
MHIAFDLDGTLIDSAESVVAALSYAFTQAKVTPSIPPRANHIGPPLTEVVAQLCPHVSESTRNQIVDIFKTRYDTHEVLNFEIFPGVTDFMGHLRDGGGTLHLITNKRRTPVERILDHAGWADVFSSVFTPDNLPSGQPSDKAALISIFLQQQNVDPSDCLYVGDRPEDKIAAEQNRVRCMLVGWGYSV